MARLPVVGAWLLVLAWLVPNHYPPWVASHSEIVAGASAGMFALAVLQQRLARTGTVAWPAVLLGLLCAVPLLQLAAGQIRYFGDAWVSTLYLAITAVAVASGTRIAAPDVDDWSRTFATAVLTGAMLSMLLALWQRFDVELGALSLFVVEMRPGYAPGANLAQPNQLATLLGLGLAALMLLFERRHIGAATALAAAALIAATMALTQSRTPLLLFLCATPLLLTLRRRLALRTRPTTMAGLFAFWAGAYLAWTPLADLLHLLPMKATLASRAQAGPRTVLWQQMIEAIGQQPWAGYGWNQVSLAQMSVLEKYPNSHLLEYSHNMLLDLAAWNGVPVTLLIMGLGLWWLWRAHARVRSPAGAFGLMIVVLLLTHAMVEFPLAYLYYLVPFALAIGLVEVDADMAPGVAMPRLVAPVAVASLWVAMVAAAMDYVRLEGVWREMRFTVARIGRPMVDKPPPLLDTMFTQFAAQHRAWLTTPKPGMNSDEVNELVAITERYGYAPLLYRSALALALNGDIEGGRRMLRRLANVHLPVYHATALGEIRSLADSEYPVLRALLPTP